MYGVSVVHLARVLGERRAIRRRQRRHGAEQPLVQAARWSGSAAGVSPLPLSTKICLPSRLKIAPVGYQPVGMNPSTKLRPPLLTSTTATALLSALATSSVWPSGDSASELGVEVGGASGIQAHRDLLDRLARERVEHPDRRAAAARDEQTLGRRATAPARSGARRCTIRRSADSESALEHLDASRRPTTTRTASRPSGETHDGVGLGRQRRPSWSTCPTARSIADSVCAKTRVAYSVRPSGLIARPPAKRLAAERRQRERARARQRAVGVRELLHVVLRGAARVQPRAVRVPREPEPGAVDRRRALDGPARDVDRRSATASPARCCVTIR